MGSGAPTDIVPIPTIEGIGWTTRRTYDMWFAAGQPPITSAGRLYGPQKAAWDRRQAYLAWLGGYGPWAPYAAPADNPDRPDVYRLPHCRGVALDVPVWSRPQMMAAGFHFPLDGTGGKALEAWHGESVGWTEIYFYPIIHIIPDFAGEQEPFTVSQYDDIMQKLARLDAIERLERANARSNARIEVGLAKLNSQGTSEFFKHGDLPLDKPLWFWGVPGSADFVRIRDKATAQLYKELNGDVQAQVISGAALRRWRDDRLAAGGRDLTAVPEVPPADGGATVPTAVEEAAGDDDAENEVSPIGI